ncbi:MAG: hypothetical protein NTX48_01505 [Planctomycetales bacterium]|nr:hypothetical protein [Planctomycetales bacterium]
MAADVVFSRQTLGVATVMPPTQLASIKVRDEPGWITFTIDGRYAYPSTGDVIEAASKRIITTLTDETGAPVMSEKMLEIQFQDDNVVHTGDQFGVGRTRATGGMPKRKIAQCTFRLRLQSLLHQTFRC